MLIHCFHTYQIISIYATLAATCVGSCSNSKFPFILNTKLLNLTCMNWDDNKNHQTNHLNQHAAVKEKCDVVFTVLFVCYSFSSS